MKVLVVDDEPLARARLKDMLGRMPDCDVVGEAGNGEAALALAEARKPDAVLLDIRMPGMDGLEVARHLANSPHAPCVIFTTAYEQHALEAFDARALDYLLKPVKVERLAAALARARRLSVHRLDDLRVAMGSARSHISATLAGDLYLVPVEEIRYFQAGQKYVTVAHGRGQLLIDEPLKSLEQEFAGRFLRIHRNALVALDHVETLEKDATGHWQVRLDGVSEPLEVSRRLVGAVRKRLKG